MKHNYQIKKSIKISAWILLVALLLTQVLPVSAAPSDSDSEAEPDTGLITISTPEDLLSLAESCVTDTWSVGKTVTLAADLDMSGTDFQSLPVFGGTFLGQNHTISGITITGGSDNMGFIRYLSESGSVYDLRLSGTANADASHSNLALLAGVNEGLISGCRVSCSVVGGDCVGAIAGSNKTSGIISDCTTDGAVYGNHSAGAMAGQNSGTIINCLNCCAVNTTASENDVDITTLSVDDILATENAASITDIGGITGSNSGIVKACVNEGAVGYQHIGYNIGGIAGSQTGYIEGCVNYGTLNGRKDVGGITGQMEPSSVLEFSEDTLQKLDREFDKLHDLLTQLAQDAGGASDSLTGQIDHLLTSVENAQQAINDLTGTASDDLNALAGRTDLSALPSPRPISLDFLDQLPTPSASPTATVSPMATTSPTATESPQVTASPMMTLPPLVATSPMVTLPPLATVSPVTTETPMATELPLTTQSPDATETPDLSGSSTTSKSPAVPETSPTTPGTSLAEPETSALSDSYELPKYLAEPEPLPTPTSLTSGSPVESSADPTGNSASPSASDSPLAGTASPSPSGWQSLLPSISPDIDWDSWEDIDREKVEDTLNDTTQNLYEDANEVLAQLQHTIQSQASILSARLASAQQSLSSSFSAIITDMDLLNSMLNDQNQLILNDFQAISDELNVIGHLITNPDTVDPDEIITDVSDQDTEADTSGKVVNCQNKGTINGDLNAGGIAGSMSRENDLDPEDDLDLDSASTTLNFRYKERIVIRECENTGSVESKRNCAGGITGNMELGSIRDCIGAGQVTAGGSMAGGIAGFSNASIRSCYAKCSLSGTDQIGGIVGSGNDISDCYSMIQIQEGENYLGSIAGKVKEDSEISGNYFVQGCPAGIDGINYTDVACPLPYEEFISSEAIPDIFQRIYLTFLADDQIVSIITLNYGDSFRSESIPAIPEKEDCTAVWEDFDQTCLTFDQTIHAIYSEYITTLESAASEDGHPVMLMEGKFEPGDGFLVTQISAYPEDSITKAHCYRVSTDSSFEGPFTMRLLIPEDMEDPSLELLVEDSWQPIASTRDGSYLVFTTEEANFVVSCVERPKTPLSPILLLVLGLLLLLGIGLLVFLLRHKKKASL